jgi:AmiR/NasT family two-component response regulator
MSLYPARAVYAKFGFITMLDLFCRKPERITTSRDENPRALAIMREGVDRDLLEAIFREADWELEIADTISSAFVSRKCPFPIVLWERELKDCEWRKAVSALSDLPQHPSVILVSGRSDKNLWDDLIGFGGSDIVRTPFDPDDVTRAIASAWSLWWHLQQLRRASARRS